MEITVYRTKGDFAKNKWLLRAPVSCPDTFDFLASVTMFKNLYPDCVVVFMS